MYDGVNGRNLYQRFKAGDTSYQGKSGVEGFCAMLTESLGLTEDEFGRTMIADKQPNGRPRMRPEEFSLKELAEAMGGQDWVRSLDPKTKNGFQGVNLLEAGQALQPSAFQDINAWSYAVGGLLQVKILEAYRKPAFVADQLMKPIPSKQRFEKLPGLARIGDKGETMNAGQPHPRVQFGQRYVETPYTQKTGLAIDVTKEAVFFDLTNQILAQAETVGDELGLRKEKRCLNLVLGITNTYKYNGTSYNTYLTSGNWVNDHANPFVDWTSFDAAEQLFADMTDQEANERITVMPDTVLSMPYNKNRIGYALSFLEVQRRTQSQAEVGTGANKHASAYNHLTSVIAFQQLTDPAYGNQTAANAKQWWVMLERQRAFGYVENWALNAEKVNAPEYIMADSGLVLSVFCDEMGIETVLEPRYAVRNKHT